MLHFTYAVRYFLIGGPLGNRKHSLNKWQVIAGHAENSWLYELGRLTGIRKKSIGTGRLFGSMFFGSKE
jgi:hypothetical protein